MKAVLPSDPATWDWSLTNKKLTALLGVSDTTVHIWRKKLGKPKVDGYTQRKVFNAEAWDWTLTDLALAKQHGVSAPTVHAWRIKLHHPFVKSQQRLPRTNKKCAGWDWTKRDATLAIEHSLSRERIRQIRLLLKKPRPISIADEHLARFKAWLGNRRKVSSSAFKDAGFHRQTCSAFCRKLGVTVIPAPCGPACHIPWDKLNWNLPDGVLNAAWGLGRNGAGNARSKQRRPKAAFRCVKGAFPVQFVGDVMSERRKGAAFKAKRGKKAVKTPEMAGVT